MATADDAPAVGSANIPATSTETSLFFMVPQYRVTGLREFTRFRTEVRLAEAGNE